jgi:Wiskott-Aldrich syndrome protein
MFRASPWITYDPPASDNHSQTMDNDTEMDAPQISTLHDDGESPPSNASPTRTGKFRVKLLVNETKVGTKFITFNGETGEEAGMGEEADEDEPEEDEEDELIDDEEGGGTSTPATSTPGAAATSSVKSGTKRPAKTKSSQVRRKARLTAPGATTAPPASAPSEAKQTSPPKDVHQDALPPVEPSSAAAASQDTSASPAPPSKRKAVPKGTTAAQRAPRKSATK